MDLCKLWQRALFLYRQQFRRFSIAKIQFQFVCFLPCFLSFFLEMARKVNPIFAATHFIANKHDFARDMDGHAAY